MGLHSASPEKKRGRRSNPSTPKRPSRPPGALNPSSEAPLQQARPRVTRRRRFVPPTASPYGLANARLPHQEQQISASSPKQIHAEITKWALYSIIYTSQVVHITALPFENNHCFHCCLSLSFTLHFYLNFVGSKLQSIQYRVFSWPPDWGSPSTTTTVHSDPATTSWPAHP